MGKREGEGGEEGLWLEGSLRVAMGGWEGPSKKAVGARPTSGGSRIHNFLLNLVLHS